MFGEEKNLKDLKTKSPISNTGEQQNISLVLSYTKTHKLVTAVYMVTDIIDKEEPIRNKLRTLSAGIISDIHTSEQAGVHISMSLMSAKISEIMSFLDIASAVHIISEMNCNILRKEFTLLQQSIVESTGPSVPKSLNLVDFFTEETNEPSLVSPTRSTFQHYPAIKSNPSQRHHAPTNLGVQSPSTLMKALSGMKTATSGVSMSDRNTTDVFDALKKERRESIIKVIKNIPDGGTIKDIKDRARQVLGGGNALLTCSEKTLQRELVSMVQSDVLYKLGEKRWSKYFIKKS